MSSFSGAHATPSRQAVTPSSFSSPLGSSRSVEIHVLNEAANAEAHFPDNAIKTSRYTLLTFFPQNLLEQFRKLSNFYFLLVMVVSVIPGASPIDPVTAIMPLAIVLVVAGAKDGYEDYKRHASDRYANSMEACVLRGDSFVKVASKDIAVGDVVRFEHGEEVRADCLLLNSALPDGLAYIETANLDGETNVKPRRAKPVTVELLGTAEQIRIAAMSDDGVRVLGSEPNPSLVSWQGQIHIEGAASAVGLEQFLFRGSIIRNTEWVLAVVLYTGVNTKMFLNLKQKPTKFSRMDADINRVIFALFVVNLLIIIVLCALAVWWTEEAIDGGFWYIDFHLRRIRGVQLFFWRFLTYFILLSFMIPISLFVTLELNKAMQLLLMVWDQRMSAFDHHTKSWRFCRPKTSNLNMQLAHVTSIFTDKTGTLTENCMNYRGGFIDGVQHDEKSRHFVQQAPDEADCETREAPAPSLALPSNPAYLYFLSLALCHAVVCFEDKDVDAAAAAEGVHGKIYEGPSPDEIALVKAAADKGFRLLYRNARQMVIDALGCTKAFNIVAELEFTAERKMMSVILQPTDRVGAQGDARTGGYYLLTKGADSAMLPLLDVEVDYNLIHRGGASQSLADMSSMGLRTLVIGYRPLRDEEVKEWLPVLHDAQCSMANRTEELHHAYCLIEKDFRLLGTTAVEDKLQEFVPETIRFFLRAGITVWMLTGDKRETAITIGVTSGMIDPGRDAIMQVDVAALPMESEDDFAVAMSVCEEQLTDALQQASLGPTVLVIDGVSLNCAFGIQDASLFVRVGRACHSAICCRLTPLQKSDVVKLFQSSTDGIVLAVGDGANDVSMIQEGKLGIGIMGLEGAQAELASDYAIPRFHHLKRLLFVHGRNCLYRDAQTILFSLYKNCMLSVTMICYTVLTGFSGVSIFDSWLLASFNLFFCSLPPLFIGMFDKDIEDEIAETHPALYKPLAVQNEFFNARSFGDFGLDVALHGLALYFIVHATMVSEDVTWRSAALEHYGTILFILVLVTIDIRAGMIISRWNFIQFFGLAVSFVLIPCFLLAYSALPSVSGENWMVGVAEEVFGSEKLYLHTCLVIGGLILIFNICRSYYIETEHPSETDKVRRCYAVHLAEYQRKFPFL